MASMTRGTKLVTTTARVTQLTGVQKLSNLEVGGGITLTDLLLVASDAIYDQLVREGETPSSMTNAEVYESAVAWHFLARLVIGRYLPLPEGMEPPQNEQGHADPYVWSDVYLRRVKPLYTSDDSPAAAGERFGTVGNPVSLDSLYGDQLR